MNSVPVKSIEAASHNTNIDPLPRSRFYRPELDVIRFVAFFGVFFHHAGFFYRPSFAKSPLFEALLDVSVNGLQLFFVLSAFLISDLLMREREANGHIDVKAFYRRRILRIWPLFILGLLMGVGYDHFVMHTDSLRFLAFFLLMGGWYCRRYGTSGNPSNVLWSITVEEQFYLFYPALARKFSRRMIALFCFVLIVIANGLLYYYGQINSISIVSWYDSFVQFEMFAAGILLALLLKQKIPNWTPWVRVLLLLAWPLSWFITIAYSYLFPNVSGTSSGMLIARYALTALGCAAFLLGMLGINRKFLPGWMVYSGRISYGLYVFHEYGMRLSSYIFNWHRIISDKHVNYVCWWLCSLAFTFILAAISYRFFESPFLKLKPERI